MPRRVQRATALALLTAFTLVGCSSGAPSPSAAPSSAAASGPAASSPAATPVGSGTAAPSASATPSIGPPEQTSLTVAVERPAFSSYELYVVADKLGYFKEEGLTVKVITADDVRAAVVGGSADIATPRSGLAYSGVQQGLDIAVFAGQNCRAEYSFAVQPDIKTADDLRGKDVLLAGSQGDSNFFARKQVLQEQGWDLDKVKPNYVFVAGGSTVWAKLFTANRLALMPIFESVRPEIVKYGGKVVVDELEAWANGFHIAKRSWLETHQNTATRFLRAIIRSAQYIIAPGAGQPPAHKAALIQMERDAGFKSADRDAQNDSPYVFSTEGMCVNHYVDADAIKTLQQVQHLDPIDIDKLLYLGPLLEAQKSLGLTNEAPPKIPWPPK